MTEDQIIAAVLKRLTLPRVGLLCDEFSSQIPETDAFSWVLYPRKTPEILTGKAKRVYPLEKISRPEDEGATLSVLVALETPLMVVGELLDGVPRTREGALILGCLGRGVPVIMDGSLSAWAWYGGTACGRHLASRLDRLRSWGLNFLSRDLNNITSKSAALTVSSKGDQKDSAAPASRSHAETSARNVRPAPAPAPVSANVNTGELTLKGPGWITWSELNGRLQNIKSIRLEGGVKLTMEARDQLIRYGIRLIEV